MPVRFTSYVCRFLLGAVMVCAIGGCKLHQKYSESSIWPLDKEQQPQTPVKVAATWSDTVSYVPGKPAMRGFGGRLYFYDQRMNAIKVDGRLVVYIFDDDMDGVAGEPQRKYQFSAEDFARHCTGSDLGPSYSIWIPWDPVGGPTKQLTIVPFFLPSEGKVVTGEQTRHRLPGVAPPASAQPPMDFSERPRAADGHYAARQVSHEEPLSRSPALVSTRDTRLQFRTTTINVPPATQQRLEQATTPNKLPQRSQPADEQLRASHDPAQGTNVSTFQPATSVREEYGERFNRPRAAPWERPVRHPREWEGGSE